MYAYSSMHSLPCLTCSGLFRPPRCTTPNASLEVGRWSQACDVSPARALRHAATLFETKKALQGRNVGIPRPEKNNRRSSASRSKKSPPPIHPPPQLGMEESGRDVLLADHLFLRLSSVRLSATWRLSHLRHSQRPGLGLTDRTPRAYALRHKGKRGGGVSSTWIPQATKEPPRRF